MSFADIPIIIELLKKENLTAFSTISDKILCKDANGDEYLIKDSKGKEGEMYSKVLPFITKQNLKFNVLVLPVGKIVRIPYTDNGVSKTRDYLIVKNYEDVIKNNWNETEPSSYGGRGIGKDISAKTVSLLEDFSKIDISTISQFNLPTFDFNSWINLNIPYMRNLFVNKIITQNHIDVAERILSNKNLFQSSRKTITNGDFYPRNFININNNKIVVIDWEGRTDYHADEVIEGVKHSFSSQRNFFINYLENHGAFFFVHMWGNIMVQKDFLKILVKTFNLKQEDIQAAIIIKALEQAVVWHNNFLSMRQAEIFVNALNSDYIKDLLS